MFDNYEINMHLYTLNYDHYPFSLRHIPVEMQEGTLIDLEITDQRFRKAFEFSAIGMALVSTEGRWLKVNKALCNSLGFSENELLNITFQDITHPEDLDTDLQFVQKMLQNQIESYQMEKRYFHKNGSLIWALLNVSAVRDKQGQVLYFISQVQDITENKRITSDLRFHESQFGHLASLVPGAIFQFEYLPNGDSRFPFVSKGFMDVFEVSEEGVKMDSANVYQRIHPEDFEKVVKGIENANLTFTQWEDEFRIILPKKGLRWVRGVARPEPNIVDSILWYGYIYDNTDFKYSNQALKEAEKRWQTALNISGDGLWDWNVSKGEMFYDSGWKSILGYEDHEIINDSAEWLKLVHPEDMEKANNELENHLLGLSDNYRNEYRMRHKDGRWIWILDRGKIIERDEQHKAVRLIGTHTDITEHKTKELELEKLLGMVSEQNNRLVNFAHIVSHNLRSHTSNISLLMKMIRDTDDPAMQMEFLNKLQKVSDQLNDTIFHLNEVVSIQTSATIDQQKIHVVNSINNILHILNAQILENKVKIDILGKEDALITFNQAYFDSIILNLITNAIKYRDQERLLVINISVKQDHEYTHISVQDNGLGVDLQRYGNKIFGMYKTFHGNKDAKGIGLFITKSQLESFGGSIEVESELGKGSVFHVKIPLTPTYQKYQIIEV